MARPTRKDPAPQGSIAKELPLAEAARRELRGEWHSLAERWAFWRRDDIPRELGPGAAPDPRSILVAEPTEEFIAAQEAAVARFKADRRAWLESVAG